MQTGTTCLEYNLTGWKTVAQSSRPSRGESFAEKHSFLQSHIEEYLDDQANLSDAASQFLIDPASLRENRLSAFFLA